MPDASIPELHPHPEALVLMQRLAIGDITTSDAFDGLCRIVAPYVCAGASVRHGRLLGEWLGRLLYHPPGAPYREELQEWRALRDTPPSDVAVPAGAEGMALAILYEPGRPEDLRVALAFTQLDQERFDLLFPTPWPLGSEELTIPLLFPRPRVLADEELPASWTVSGDARRDEVPRVGSHPEILSLLDDVGERRIQPADGFATLCALVGRYLPPGASEAHACVVGAMVARRLFLAEYCEPGAGDRARWQQADAAPATPRAAARGVWLLLDLVHTGLLRAQELPAAIVVRSKTWSPGKVEAGKTMLEREAVYQVYAPRGATSTNSYEVDKGAPG